jgi:hypothetical protein
LGGWAGDRLGVAPTLALAAGLHLVTVPILWLSPLRRLEAFPEPLPETA